MTHNRTQENVTDLKESIYRIVSENPRALSRLVDSYVDSLSDSDFSDEFETYVDADS